MGEFVLDYFVRCVDEMRLMFFFMEVWDKLIVR